MAYAILVSTGFILDLHGPFSTLEEAWAWAAEGELPDGHWQIVRIMPPHWSTPKAGSGPGGGTNP